MNFSDYFFYFVAVIILLSAAAAVFSPKIKTSIAAVLISLSLMTIIFFFLGSDYIAVLHFLIFVIGTPGILLFTYYKMNAANDNIESGGSFLSVVIVSVFSALLTGILISGKWPETLPQKPGFSAGEITGLINLEYLLPFFVIAIILFIGIIGTSYLTRKTE